MSKLTGPMFSLEARKTLAGAITYQNTKSTQIARKKPVPFNTKTTCQLNRRQVFLHGANKWRSRPDLVTPEMKVLWAAQAEGLSMTAYNLFMSKYLAVNLAGCNIVSPQVIPLPNGYTVVYYRLLETGDKRLLE